MTKSAKIVIGIIIIILIWLGYFYYKKPVEQETVKIGFIGPLSGDLASWGENEKLGVNLALEEINKEGGIIGRKVEVIYEDSQCDPKSSVSAAKKLIEIDKVYAIVGDTCSSAVLAIAPFIEANKVVLISPAAGSDKISDAGDYIFRNFISNKMYSVFAAKVFKEDLNKSRAAILYINSEYGVNLSDVFIENFKGEIVFNEGYPEKIKDFRSILSKLNSKQPDIVFLAGYYPDGALILKQAKELGIKTEFFGATDGYEDPQLIELAGTASEGFKFFSVPMGAGPVFEKFSDAYRIKYNKEPQIYSDFAYDAFMVVAKALKAGGLSPEEVKDAMYKTDYAGASNQIRFNKNGDIIVSKIVIKEIKNGQFVPYEK